MIGAVGVLAGRSEPDGGTGARRGLGAADPGGAGPGSGEGTHGEEGPSPQQRDRPIIPSMAQPPAPRTNPGLPDKFVVRSQISGNRIINVLAGLILFILAVMTLFFIVFLLSYDSY